MLKKVVVVAILGGLGYKIYKKATGPIDRPASLIYDPTSKDTEEHPKAAKVFRYLTRRLRYSGFCEITGCKVEIHASTAEVFDKVMREHLEKGHP